MSARGRWSRMVAFALGIACVLLAEAKLRAAEIHVSPLGQDDAAGTATAPLRTVSAAQRAARKAAGREPVAVVLHAGIFYLPETLIFTAEDSGTGANPVIYAAASGEEAALS